MKIGRIWTTVVVIRNIYMCNLLSFYYQLCVHVVRNQYVDTLHKEKKFTFEFLDYVLSICVYEHPFPFIASIGL